MKINCERSSQSEGMELFKQMMTAFESQDTAPTKFLLSAAEYANARRVLVQRVDYGEYVGQASLFRDGEDQYHLVGRFRNIPVYEMDPVYVEIE